MSLSAQKRATWNRVAAHIAAGYRLRRKLAAGAAGGAIGDAEAVLAPSGRLEHATGAAAEAQARAALCWAAGTIERARGKLRRTEPETAVEEWKGLVAARWTLLDHFESDGRRYLLARRNDVQLDGPDALSERERQVLGYAELGHSNKLIAYEMGISSSTVGVLLWRAARKLRAASRPELMRAFSTFDPSSSAPPG